MSYEDRQEEIELVVLECESYWRAMGISPQKVEEMRSELESHLQEAMRDGKPVESVTGGDTLAFAEEWGKPYTPYQSPAGRAAEQVAFVFIGAALAGTVGHLWRRSYEVPYDLRKSASGLARGHVAGLTVNFSMRQYVRRSGLVEDLEELSWRNFFVQGGALTAGYAALLGINLAAKGGDHSAFSEWSWKSTIVSGFVGGVSLWLTREKQREE